MIKSLCCMSVMFFLATLSTSTLFAADAASKSSKVDFAREILPILSNKCFVCHGPDAENADAEDADTELRLDSFAGATHVQESDTQAINPKNLEESELLVRIHSADDPMPPENQKNLTPAERDLLSRWVRQGGDYAKHWAFVPPQKSQPKTKGPSPKNKIDAFFLALLEKNKTAFALEADRATLARRVALTLTGLPPEPQQLANYLADKAPGAYERLVDQLLQNPRFGEHQARYWLDAVRYGDTHGLHLDNRRGIYPYRDWVVQAFNDNLPLDDFITWQLAGDLLPDPSLAQRVATGFVRMNPTTSEGGVIPAEFQAKNNFDRTETLGTVLLGMTLTCARCHTHKYDPIPQTEYYRILAFLNNTSERPLDGNSYVYGPVIKAPANQAAWGEWAKIEAARDQLLSEAVGQIAAEISADRAKAWKSRGKQDRLSKLADPKGPYTKLPVYAQAVALVKQIAIVEKGFTTTLVAAELGRPRKTQLLDRGDYEQPIGDVLEPGILTVLGPFPKDAPRNRLGLAQWLTSRDHPLVSRVLINRIWQRVFGNGLVRTPEDFGLQGQQPTHPQLLDWLAVELQESGWDMKHMLRMMVTSRTFRQSSARRKEVSDPANLLFARGPSYRLDAEVIRDMGLWSSGLLNPTMGGEGFKPYQPDRMWSALSHPGSNTKKYVQDKGNRVYQRSLYIYWKRTSPHPMMTIFDAPSREASCVKRSRTSSALMSLALLNEKQRIEMGRMLAQRLLQSAQDDASRFDMLFRLLASRKPNDRERAACGKLLQSMRARYKDAEKDALALLALGETPRDTKLSPAEHAAWTQVAITLLASDLALLLY